MGASWRLSAACALLLLAASCAALPADEPYIDLTRYFTFSATSVCGDTPTLFEFPKNSGQFQNCSGSEYSEDNVLDGDLNTRWQSISGETPVTISFTLNQPALSLRLEGIRMRAGAGGPRYLYLEERPAGEQNFTTLRVYVRNVTVECEGIVETCGGYTVEEVPTGAVILFCPGTFSEPVSEIRMRLVGFQDIFENETSQYYSTTDVNMLGWVAGGNYARSLTALTVEGETGDQLDAVLALDEPVPVSTDEALMAGFSSRGFADISVDINSQVYVQWTFEGFPQSTSYQLWLRYSNLGPDRVHNAMVMQDGLEVLYNARVVLLNCPPPSICYAPLGMASNISNVASFSLLSGAETSLIFTLSDVQLYLDSIFAVPTAFYEATELEESDGFLQSCNFIDGSLGQGTGDEQFCQEGAVELSIHFYQSTYVCGCGASGATGEECAVYGGQCECIDQSDGFSRITGRRCDMCPFTTYLTSSGCTECGCSDPTENCAVATGQCACPALVTGRLCDSCVVNSFGDPLEGCSPCQCSSIGTEQCNVTTGECHCKPGVMGDRCDECDVGFFNLTSLGCEECECDSAGSVGSACDDSSGQCICKLGVTGLKCTDCMQGFYFFNTDGCVACDCSGLTNDCSQNTSVTSEPSEVCSCPQPYVGDTCDRCDAGFFLSAQSGSCEPCSCNGLADVCLDGDGTCVGCRGNSSGASCDVCVDTYYDADPSDPGLLCTPCPCSITTALDTVCSADPAGNPVCSCRPGHEGQTCDSCSDGYFGQPPEFRCTRCDCNGNIDPDVPGSCDMTTGRCILCINNSTGDECEDCADGYFGNAILQDCQPCDCNALGSEGSLCDRVSGQCSCLPGVNGLRCEQCLPTFWNFTSGVGCQACACSGSASSNMCNVVTGSCDCTEGVGGPDCSFCLPGYFDFSASGCSSCECGEGAVNDSCSVDGQCYCRPGVGGAKCDLCEPFHFNLSASGCEPCGECEQNLRSDLEREDGRLEEVEQQADLLIQLSEVDGRGLGEVGRVSGEVGEDVEETRERLEQVQSQVDTVNASYVATRETVDDIEQSVEDSLSLTYDLQQQAEDVSNYIQGIYNTMQQGLVQLVDSTTYAETVQPITAEQAELAAELASNVTAIAEQHEGNFSDALETTDAAYQRARSVADSADMAQMLSGDLSREADNLIGRYQNASGEVEAVSSSVEEVRTTLEDVRSELEAAENSAALLRDDAVAIDDIVTEAQLELDTARLVVDETETELSEICEQVDALRQVVGNVSEVVSGSGTDPGLLEPEQEVGMEPGSGLGSGVEPEPYTIVEGVARLREGVEGVRGEVMECDGVVAMAEDVADRLEQEAANIDSVLSGSLEAGGVAVEAILNLTSSLDVIQEALDVAATTNTTLKGLLEELESVGGGDLVGQASSLQDTAQRLLEEAQEEARRAEDLLPEVEAVQELVEAAVQQTQAARWSVLGLSSRVDSLNIATDTTLSQSSLDLSSASTSLNITSTIHTSLLTLITPLPDDTAAVLATVNETQVNSDLAAVTLDNANATLAAAWSGLNERRSQLDEAEGMRVGNAEALGSLTTDLDSLRVELEQARRAAASIDVALRFYGNSSLGYDAVTTASDSATRISLVFNPSQTTGLMLYSSAGGVGQQSLSLQLSDGSVGFSTEVGGDEGVEHVVTATSAVQEDTWYQLFATREGSTSQLSVSPLQGGVTHTASLFSSSPPSLPLPPNGTVYLGGGVSSELLPAPPSPVAAGYRGCLDRVVINNSPLSLLLPALIEGGNPQTCGPRPPMEPPRAFETGAWLQGGGSYVQVTTSLIAGMSPLSIQLSFRTFATDGLVLAAYSEDMVQSVVVMLVEGRLRLRFSLDMITMATVDTVGVVNEGAWHTVEVGLDGNTGFLLVDSDERVNASAAISSTPFNPSSDRFFVGGLPPNVQAAIGSSPTSLAGCVRYLQVGGEAVSLNTSLTSSRVSFTGCPAEVAPGVRFSGEGLAVLSPPLTEEVSRVSLAFHSTQLASLLLAIGSDSSDSVVVSLYHTRLRVDGLGSVLESSQDGLNNDAWHYVELVLENDRMNLTVDGETVTTPTSGPRPPTGSDVTVGGVTPPTSVPVTENFRGCMDQLAINDMPVDIGQAQSLDGVFLYGCSPASSVVTTPLPPPPPPLPPPPSTNPNISVGLDGQEGSFLAIPLDKEDLVAGHSIILEFQTSSPNAMLLYTQGNFDFLALELIRGVLYYTYHLGSGRVILGTTGTYNDGLEHSVELYRSGRNGTMIVDDGVEVISGFSPGSFSSLNVETEMLFVGGTPLTLPPTNLIRFRTTGEEIPPSTLGCILSLSVNGDFANLSSPQASSGTEQCREFYNNVATFQGSGYLQLLDEVDGGVMFSASLEFRTASCTGLLLYVASSTHPDHTALEMVDGVMRFIFDNGPGPSFVEYLPPSPACLCDNQWHSVSLVKDGIRGTLSVDGANPVSESSNAVNFVSLDTDSPFFVGGVPDDQVLRPTVISRSFAGCIRNLYLSTVRTGPLERDLAQASQSRAVTFHTCNP